VTSILSIQTAPSWEREAWENEKGRIMIQSEVVNGAKTLD